MVTSIVETRITPYLDGDTAYRFWMPDTLRGSLPELRRHGTEIGEAIVNGLDRIHSGRTIGSTVPEREWRFRVEGAHDRDWDEPSFGIRFVFGGCTSSLDWGEVPDGLRLEVERLLNAASRKFVNHSDARRILVLDFIGDIRHPNVSVLTELFDLRAVPNNIDEIWFFTHDLVTELHYGWIFRSLWPTVGDTKFELCGETVVPTE